MNDSDSRKDWRIDTQEQVARRRNWLRQGRMPESQRNWVQFEVARLQYHLDRNIDPNAVSGPLFTRGFANASSYWLLPLLAIVFASDIVSSEFSQGTIKLLLTRPVSRSRVLGAKLAALMIAISLTVLVGGAVAYLFSGIAYGYRGMGSSDPDRFPGGRRNVRRLRPSVRCLSGRTRSRCSVSRGSPRRWSE